jgi:hypothetical protein
MRKSTGENVLYSKDKKPDINIAVTLLADQIYGVL